MPLFILIGCCCGPFIGFVVVVVVVVANELKAEGGVCVFAVAVVIVNCTCCGGTIN